ncbi:Crp/Fnr family transcriptional regulator [Lacihabitans sp. LS3-19]|uniref:Crp/Fnr family transcriptional regulator n=1 Tax=Lacihabitans sp. LS3-19 TaxID=2487335 RepID=UPI0020CF639A|nr:Crp/Fnr family transcriptional regulator [Lacihabitans sp. LS3-19]MCP9770281.1 Crp/Fnr family transcriptional regulator [Lacihabitans sp. LS3-19]
MQKAIEVFRQHYVQVCPEITNEELDFVSENLTISEFKAKDYYLKNGDVQYSLGFLVEGLMKSFYIDQAGNEITVWFTKENEYATDYPAFIRQIPAKYHVQCLEPCLVVNLPYEDVQTGYAKYKTIERYGRLVTEEVLIQQQSRLESFLFQNAEQRYLDFIQTNPTLFNRVSLTDLSSYLGIERQSLSRIRKSISQK